MLRHNKKRNSYIIYEQLLSLTTRLAASGNNDEAKYIVGFIKQYYHPTTEIAKELKILESLVEKSHQKDQAEKILEEALKQASTLNFEKLQKEKTALIDHINKKISVSLFDMPVKEYKTMASAQILINEVKDNFVNTTPTERVKLKNFIVEKMTVNPEPVSQEKVDDLTFAILVNNFNKKYSQLMNEDQRELLSAWSNYLIEQKEEKLNSVVCEKIEKLKQNISKFLKESNGKEYRDLLFESYNKLSCSKYTVNEQSLYELMRYFDLVEELNNEQR